MNSTFVSGVRFSDKMEHISPSDSGEKWYKDGEDPRLKRKILFKDSNGDSARKVCGRAFELHDEFGGALKAKEEYVPGWQKIEEFRKKHKMELE